MCLSVCVLQNLCLCSCIHVCECIVILYASSSVTSESICMFLQFTTYLCSVCIYTLNVCVCALLCVFVQLFVCCCSVWVPGHVCVCLPACSVAMMALFWMIDVLEGAARSSGWARASVWHTAASLLLYICRRSKTPPPLPSDSAPAQPTLTGSFLGLYFQASVYSTKIKSCVLFKQLPVSHFIYGSWPVQSQSEELLVKITILIYLYFNISRTWSTCASTPTKMTL